MKTPHFADVAVLFVVTVMMGCQSPRAARIQEKTAVFAALDPFSQKLIQDGLFDLGFTSEHIYMSLGKPDKVTIVDTLQGPMETWTYRNFIYGDARTIRFNTSGVVNRPSGRSSSASASTNSGTASAPQAPAQPTIADMKGPALATLLLDLLNGRVIAARIEE